MTSSDTASLNSFVIYCYFNLLLSDELGDSTDKPVFSNFCWVDAAERGAARFSNLTAVTVLAVVESFDAIQLHRTAPLR
jgi:hypothetical protein